MTVKEKICKCGHAKSEHGPECSHTEEGYDIWAGEHVDLTYHCGCKCFERRPR